MTQHERRLTTVIVVGLLALGSAALSRLPTPEEVARSPFVSAGTVGAPVPLRTGTIQVDAVRASTAVRQGGTTARTSAHWLVVTMRFTAAREPVGLAGMTLRAADGRIYSLTRPFRSSCGPGQPGITIQCGLPFEVPSDAMAGARLVVPAALLGGGEGDDVAEIDLGIDPAQAGQLASATELITVEALAVVGGASQP